jgi:hypothetical protein
VSNTSEVANASAPAPAAIAAALAPSRVDSETESTLSAVAIEMAASAGIKAIAEPIAAVARLTGHARVLIAGCRRGDGASTVAGALALNLSAGFGLDTLLASGSSGTWFAFGKGGVQRPVHSGRSVSADPWAASAQSNQDDGHDNNLNGAFGELRELMGRYRAAVIDAGVLRVDPRMLAAARPEDPVLMVARYGRTRRDEVAATVAIVKLAHARMGGVILNSYETPALDRMHWLPGLGRDL